MCSGICVCLSVPVVRMVSGERRSERDEERKPRPARQSDNASSSCRQRKARLTPTQVSHVSGDGIIIIMSKDMTMLCASHAQGPRVESQPRYCAGADIDVLLMLYHIFCKGL